MFNFKYVLESLNSIFARKKTREFYCVCFTRVRVGVFLKLILKLRVCSEKILILNSLLVVANLNR